MKLLKVSIIIYVLFMMQGVIAYEIDTHARITQKAYELSILNDEDLQTDFGISGVNDFGKNYFDINDVEIVTRGSTFYEDDIIRDTGSIASSIQGWLMRGTIREDDCSNVLIWWGKCSNPTDGPVNENRPLNHFFDPIYNRPLTVVTALGETAVNWSLGTLDAFTLSIKDQRHINHFTMFDAREAQYRALTGHTKEGTKDIAPSGTNATEPQIREAYWATVFGIVGNSVKRNGGHKHA